MNLLLDLGNSRLKWALTDADRLRVGDPVAWCEPDVTALLRECWCGMQPQRVLAADVVGGEWRSRVAKAAADCFDTPVEWLRSPAEHAGVRNAYVQPENLGIDRFAALLAAHADGRAPCVIAHCGSTLVLDALAPQGRHLGGLIAPGLAAMRAGLHGAAPGLPTVAGDEPVIAWAASTEQAIASGTWQALAGAVAHFYRHAVAQLGGDVALLLTGGDAAVIGDLLGPPATLFEHAVLRGLALLTTDDGGA